MKKLNAIVISFLILILGIILLIYSLNLFLVYIAVIILLEISSYFLIKKLRETFPWLITKEDEYPVLSKDGLKKFLNDGYDAELGWSRKPYTWKQEIGRFGKTCYHIDGKGSRKNPRHEKLPKKISFYGDSFLFARQVNDNQSCQWYLSELTKTNILNFSVGNYGFDQALLRLKREYTKNKTRVVVIGVVPSTIVRILCMWKHYNEFGNTFGFKPRFVIKKGKLKLIRNFIDKEEKFLEYKKYIGQIRKRDYFYKTKFKKEMIEFPYFVSILSDPLRNIMLIFHILASKLTGAKKELEVYPSPMKIIMKINLKLRYDLFTKNKNAIKLFEKLVDDFVDYSKKNDFKPVFLFMPQKDDLLFIRQKGPYYDSFIQNISKKIYTIDLTEDLMNRDDLDEIYSDDNKYGGHYSKFGNKVIAKIIYENLKNHKII